MSIGLTRDEALGMVARHLILENLETDLGDEGVLVEEFAVKHGLSEAEEEKVVEAIFRHLTKPTHSELAEAVRTLRRKGKRA